MPVEQQSKLYSREPSPFLRVRSSFTPLSIVFKGQTIPLSYHKGRGFLLASCILYLEGTSPLPNVRLIANDGTILTSFSAVITLFSHYDIRTPDISKNDEILTDRRDCLFPYLTLLDRNGKCYHLQCPSSLQEEYEEGVNLADAVFN